MTPVLGQRLRAERAFERLYQRHVGDVYRYSLAILRNPSDAEDVTQTTFLNAYRAYRSGERPDSPRAWLIAIAHNVCRQRFRQAQRRPREVAFDDGIGATFASCAALVVTANLAILLVPSVRSVRRGVPRREPAAVLEAA